MNNNKVIVGDLIFFLIFPLVIWNFGREYTGDYYAMLLSSVPGIIYSVIRFMMVKKINISGLFIITNLVLGTLIDVIAGSAIQMLWNNVYYGYFLGFVFVTTIFINKPFALLFSLDFAELQGADRESTKVSFYQRKVLFVFKLITLGFAVREILLASVKVWLIMEYGVESFDKGLILKQVLSWGITAISVFGFVYIYQLLSKEEDKAKEAVIE
ncbi:VC0807 family protein [Priestia taiwanensis]|uniref:Intracellular septation protein A n=1 Tax=Priestia taiwanensis TaxID=1347902 RepID=A0A917AUC1_9BACI|nr:VC0807 family protein [Priestia taiwanensis]MBM7365206.1 hypothetical protein [Priestia taiwanensis]GGE73684.1 hypothetical protein GCM10007140_24500 [Priestia taiwanensis]